MWDDLSPFLVGSGPTATVLDPDGTPNNILDTLRGGSVRVGWSFSGSASAFLAAMRFTVTLYADPVGPAPNIVVGTVAVGPGNPGPAYQVTIPVPPGYAPDAYRLTTLITTVLAPTGQSLPIAGFIDGPIIQVRPGP
jgi:hypothetical protein